MLGRKRKLGEGGKEGSEIAENRGNALGLAEEEEIEEKEIGVRSFGEKSFCRGNGGKKAEDERWREKILSEHRINTLEVDKRVVLRKRRNIGYGRSRGKKREKSVSEDGGKWVLL